MRMFLVATLAACVLAGHGDAMSTLTLAQRARYEATHGGIRGSCYGCASPRMKRLVRELIRRQFSPAGLWAVRRALCISGRESGDNPGAISSSDDHNVAQINRPSWGHRYDFRKLAWDPVYGVWVFWDLSHHARDFSPWRGGRYSC